MLSLFCSIVSMARILGAILNVLGANHLAIAILAILVVVWVIHIVTAVEANVLVTRA